MRIRSLPVTGSRYLLGFFGSWTSPLSFASFSISSLDFPFRSLGVMVGLFGLSDLPAVSVSEVLDDSAEAVVGVQFSDLACSSNAANRPRPPRCNWQRLP